MSVLDRLSDLLAALIVVSLSWVSGGISPGALPAASPADEPGAERLMVGWAQQVEQPPIEQVGETSGDDVETLDEGAPPADSATAADPETMDAGAPPAQSDDVETLDQGAPPATTGQQVGAVSTAPATDATSTSVASEPTATTSGPVLPEGFGAGRVHAVAGRGEMPIGLADCHVGAVTGRAYVGLDCGEGESSSFVGHAPSFESFPFVVEADFPFEGDEAFFTEPNFPFGDDSELAGAREDSGSESDVFVSARGGNRARDDESSTDPVVETGGESSVAFAQRARGEGHRDRGENRSRRNEGGKKRAHAEANRGETNTESGTRDGKNGDGKEDGVKADGKKQKSKNSSKKKDRSERKHKKHRARDRQ